MIDFSLKSYHKINDLGAGRPGKRSGAGNGRFLIKVLLRNQRFGRRAVRRAAGGALGGSRRRPRSVREASDKRPGAVRKGVQICFRRPFFVAKPGLRINTKNKNV